jgi:hypothetical protein
MSNRGSTPLSLMTPASNWFLGAVNASTARAKNDYASLLQPQSSVESLPKSSMMISTRSKNCSSELAYPQLDSQATHSGRALPSLLQQTESQRTTSNSLVDGKAMLLRSTSTKSTNTKTQGSYFSSILNSTTSTTSRLLNSSLPWLRRINDYALGNPSGPIATSSIGT